MKNLLFYGLCLGLLCLSYSAKANHVVSTSISYACLGNQQYEITYKVYSYCINFPANNSYVVNLDGMGSCSTVQQQYTIPLWRKRLVPVFQYQMGMNQSSCFALSPINQVNYYEEATYIDTITLPASLQNCPWRLWTNSCCRSASLTNIANPGSSNFYTEVLVLDTSGICNNSAQTEEVPVDVVHVNGTYSIAQLATDADGDSLVYSLSLGMTDSNSFVLPAAALSANQPFYTTPINALNLHPITGDLTFTPRVNMNQVIEFDIVIEEYRAGQLIAINRKHYYLQVISSNINSTNSIPYLQQVYKLVDNTWIAQGTNTIFEVCPNENLAFKLEFEDEDLTDTLFLDTLYTTLQKSYPNALITVNNPSSNQLVVEVLLAPVANRGFQFSITDNQYPIAGNQSYGIAFVPKKNCGRIWGYAFEDGDNDCFLDNGEPRLGAAVVTLSKGNQQQTTTTLPSGYYNFMLHDTGTYTLTVQQGAPYRTLCNSASTVLHASPTSIINHNLPTTVTTLCPFLEVGIGSTPLLACSSNAYVVTYANTGTASSAPASVVVELDPLFVVDSSSLAWTSQNGQQYTFMLGSLPPNSRGSFSIYGQLDPNCGATLGPTICAQAHIYPDSNCTTWAGPQLKVEGQCQHDSVSFRILNIGQQAMTNPTAYRVIKDNSLYFTSNAIALAAGASSPWRHYAADGATYRLEIDQAATYPWGFQASATVEGCLDSSASTTVSRGFVNIFSLDDGVPYQAVDCQALTTLHPSTAKEAFPVGYGNAHSIRPQEDLVYRIHFQNTTAAPVQKVVVVDSLSPLLDASSLQVLTASHPYTWRILENNVLTVTFDNIQLPDSASNRLASKGFVDLQIQQKANTPLGSIINNRAAVYLDNKAPLWSNAVFHTIDDNFMVFTALPQPTQGHGIRVTAFPNPFEQATTLQVQSAVAYQELEVEVYNALGQLVEQVRDNTGSQSIQIQRKKLTQGLYFYQLRGDGQLLHAGQLVVQ